MNVRRAVLVRFPDDLVDELDDAGLLVALGDFLVLAHHQFHRVVFGHLVESFRADAVVFFERFLDFDLRGQRELDWHPRVEAHRVHHRRVERVARGHLQHAVVDGHGQHGILERDLRGDFGADLVFDGEFG